VFIQAPGGSRDKHAGFRRLKGKSCRVNRSYCFACLCPSLRGGAERAIPGSSGPSARFERRSLVIRGCELLTHCCLKRSARRGPAIGQDISTIEGDDGFPLDQLWLLVAVEKFNNQSKGRSNS
jgi:hypothetical protein